MVAQKQRGSIYVLTLMTVAAVASMVLIGVAVRSSMSGESDIVRQVNANSIGTTSAAELALAQVMADEDWVTTATSGKVFTDLAIGDTSYTCTVVDADTLATPTDSTTKYRLIVTSKAGISSMSSRFDMTSTSADYLATMKTARAISYWPMNEKTGSTVTADLIGVCGGVYLEPKIAGQARNDEGGVVPLFLNSDDHVETPYDKGNHRDPEGTVSLWMNLAGTSRVTTYGVFGQRYSYDDYLNVSMICTTGSLSAWMTWNGIRAWGIAATTTHDVITVGQWHHVALVWNSDGVFVYVDGALEASNTKWAVDWSASDNADWGQQPLVIGAGYIPVDRNQPLVGFDGSIAHFALLKSALNSTQVARLAEMKPDFSNIELQENTWARVVNE